MANGDYYEGGTIMSYKNDPVLGKVAHENSTGVLEKGPKRKLIISRDEAVVAFRSHKPDRWVQFPLPQPMDF